MSGVINIQNIEELYKFLNDKGVLEIALRNKNSKFKAFQKVALNNLPQNELQKKAEEAIALLNKNNQIAERELAALGKIAQLNQLDIIMSGLNLCATCAGFAIMHAELSKMSSQINKVVEVVKQTEGIHADYEYQKILSEHSNMLDCRRKQKCYSEDQMRELVSQEYAVLRMLLNYFETNTSGNREELVYSLVSLSSMLAVSLKYFDEVYYFNNREALMDDDVWHSDHDKWMSTYERMSSKNFIKLIQDYGFFELGLSTIENDYFYTSFYNQVQTLKQEIEDNQNLINTIDDPELLKVLTEYTNDDVKTQIKEAFTEVGITQDLYDNALRMAVA